MENRLIGLRQNLRRTLREAALAGCLSLCVARAAAAQGAQPVVERIDLSAGRSYPIQTISPVTKISVANPDVADAVVIGERDVVINGKAPGETDVLLFTAGGAPRQYRFSVHTAPDRPQIVLAVKLAEVRRDRLTQVGLSQFYLGRNGTAGTGTFNQPGNVRPGEALDSILVNTGQLFTNVLGFNNARSFYAFLQAEQQRGDARVLAEPTLMAANRDSASFLAGGELPIPIVQPQPNGGALVTIVFREFGVKLNFFPEVISDSLIKLYVRPEVSSLDYGNAITLQGFRIPALRTRRVSTTVDVRRDESLIISGLFNEERERVRTGIPLLMNIPILGHLFSSTRWQRNETELIAIVTPTVFNPLTPRARDTLRVLPDTTLPAREAIEKRLPAAPRPAPSPRRP
jgi:pilus assembly protein CpaC